MVQEARQDPNVSLDAPVTSEPAIGPMPGAGTRETRELEVKTMTAQKVSDSPTKLEDPRHKRGFLYSFSHVMLTLTLISIVGFIGGAAIAASILLGVIDLDAAWIKDLIKAGKEAVNYIRH